MPEDCRDRWRNYLKDDEYRNRDMWTEYEVECLREAVAQCMDAMREANREQMERDGYGRDPPEQPDEEEKDMINWGIVSAKLGGSRSRLQCSYKWKWLQEDFLRKMKEPDKKLKKVVARGPKKLNAWRAKRAEKKYPFMLPGDKYDLLDALSQLGVNGDSGISWRYIGQKSYRAVWTAAVSRYAYFEMKKTIPNAETMTFSEVVATLKEKLEKEHADELDTHWVPPPEDLVSKDSKKKSKKTELSKETVAASDVDDDDDVDTTNNNIANGHSKTNTNIKAHEHPTHNDPTAAQEKSTSDTESDTHTHTPTPEIPTSSDEDEPDPEVPDSDDDQPETHMRDGDIDEKLARQLELLHDA
ncbi:MAG: RNA polymerase I enhancer binding protein [Pleopsidium flavum]|nr:MAG: RNA polymerase I enhancer binding protein [Pleopsidium flavum]